MDALAFLSAAELAARIRDGYVTAREAVEASIRRIEALDPHIGAFIELDGVRAVAEATAIVPEPPGDGNPGQDQRLPPLDL